MRPLTRRAELYSPSMAFEIKQHDRRPRYRVALTANGDPVDLTGAVGVNFQMYSGTPPSGSVKVAKTDATIVDALTGVVEYAWTATDTDTTGTFNIEFEVDWGGGETQTFPSTGYFTATINPDLG